MPLTKVDKLAESYAINLDKVLTELEAKVTAVLGKAKTLNDNFDAATLLNSRGEMLQALRDSGYYELANKHVAEYPNIIAEVKKDFAKKDLPDIRFTDANKQIFDSLAKADLEMFANIGAKAVDDLRLELYRQAISSRPFSEMVKTIKASTTGVDKKGSPLKNYAYTHANTAALNFSGEVIREAGEALAAERWQVLGPQDDVTREECRAALADPIRTEEEWQAAGYWGGCPGGYNCRHMLYPYIKSK